MHKLILTALGIALGGAVTAVSGLYGMEVAEKALHLRDAPVVAQIVDQDRANSDQLERVLDGGSASAHQ